MKAIKFAIFLIFCSFYSFSQTPNDCVNAITVCGNGTFTSNASGIGAISEVTGCGGLEHNSIWLKINIVNAGTLGFNLIPTDTDLSVDYDFWVYGANNPCGSLGSPIRCCTTNPLLAGLTSNVTGMIGTTITTTSGPGAGGNGFVRWLNVLPGQFYYIAIDRPVGDGGFQLQWTGTAMDNGGAFPTPPTAAALGEVRSCSITPNVGVFDFNNIKSQINSDLINNSISFYLNAENATDGISPLPNIYGNISNPQTVFARVKNNISGCFTITSFQLKVYEVPNATITTNTPTICNNGTGNITINGTPNATIEYNINSGTTQIASLNNLGVLQISTPLTSTSTYTLTKVKIVDTSNVTLCTENLNNAVIITVTPDNTVTAGTTTTLCIDTILPTLTHTTTGATGMATTTTNFGLPSGVTALWGTNTISISGTPTVFGTFNYNIPLTGGCGIFSATGTIIVTPKNTVSVGLTSTTCLNTSFTTTHTTTGATGIGIPSGLPPGITALWGTNTITISGTPTTSGTFPYTISLTGGCGTVNATGTIIVMPINTVTPGVTTTLCVDTVLPTLTHSITGASGIGTPSDLPPGVTAIWGTNTITISGTPRASGTFNYTIPLTGGCGTFNATGTITVTPNNTVMPTSTSPSICINNTLTTITHTTTGASGIGIGTNLPPGITATWLANTIIMSGIPTASGLFAYTIPLTGGCSTVNATGTITVNPENTVSPASSSPIVCLNSAIPTITHTTTGVTGIGTALGLPPGITAVWSTNTISISGSANVTGLFNYSIPLTGGCGSIVATGTIEVTNGILPTFNPIAPVCQGATINLPTSSLNTPPIVGVWNLISSTANDVTYGFTPNPGQCALTTTMTIVVHPLPTVTPSVMTQSFCSGGTTNINLTSNVPGSAFYWTATGTSVTGQSGSITGSGATSINQTLVLNTNQVAAGQVTYVIVAEANGCLGPPVTVVVTVKPIPNVIVSPASLTETICSGGTTNISFSGAINNTVYSWSVVSSVGVSGALNGNGTSINQSLTTTGTSQGTVVYEVTPSLNGCTGTPKRITVTVNPVPEIFGSATHPDLCSGERPTSISVSTFNVATVYNWVVVPVGVSGASAGTDSGLAIVISQLLTTTGTTRGYVDYIITPVLTGCPGLPITVRVYVNPLPVVSLTDGTICVNAAGVPFQTYELDSGLNDVDYDFVWTFGGVTIPGATSATYTATQVGTYSVVATNSTTNCVSNVATALVTPTIPATGLTITQSEFFSDYATITVNVIGGTGTLLYQLDDGVLQESNVFTDVSGGKHIITVVDTQGCTYLTKEVMVIDYPKYFTPNGDGIHDTWNIKGLNQPDAKIFIFDRYGKLLKQITPTETSQGWDGTYIGSVMPSTDYWFTIEYKENDQLKQFKAHFALKK